MPKEFLPIQNELNRKKVVADKKSFSKESKIRKDSSSEVGMDMPDYFLSGLLPSEWVNI